MTRTASGTTSWPARSPGTTAMRLPMAGRLADRRSGAPRRAKADGSLLPTRDLLPRDALARRPACRQAEAAQKAAAPDQQRGHAKTPPSLLRLDRLDPVHAPPLSAIRA